MKRFLYSNNERIISMENEIYSKGGDVIVEEEVSIEKPADPFDEFNKRLFLKYPDITRNEKMLCGFLKLNMSTKEISVITGKKEHTIEIARTRLRKKVGLTKSNVNLNAFMDSI